MFLLILLNRENIGLIRLFVNSDLQVQLKTNFVDVQVSTDIVWFYPINSSCTQYQISYPKALYSYSEAVNTRIFVKIPTF